MKSPILPAAFALALLPTVRPAAAETDAARVFKLAREYTVRVRTEVTTPFVEDELGSFSGAGFLVDAARGWVVTNAHVVTQSPSEVEIAFAGEAFRPARKIYVDSFTDVAVIAVDGPLRRSAAPLACGEAPLVGEPVGVFGHPLGTPFVGTRGIVSGHAEESGTALVQIDATVDHGNSGGPVISLRDGRVVGIATAGAGGDRADRVNFATPMADVCRILALLRERKSPCPPVMAFSLLVNDEDHTTLMVGATHDPARWPFEPRDRIVRTGASDTLRGLSDLVTALRGRTGRVPIVVERGGRLVTITAAPLLRAPITERRGYSIDGALIAPIELEDGQDPRSAWPLMVQSVEPGSRAATVGIAQGDLVRSVNGRPVADLDSLEALVARRPAEEPVRLVLCRFSGVFRRLFDLQARELPCAELRRIGATGAASRLSSR